jgi:hypothetical protein
MHTYVCNINRTNVILWTQACLFEVSWHLRLNIGEKSSAIWFASWLLVYHLLRIVWIHFVHLLCLKLWILTSSNHAQCCYLHICFTWPLDIGRTLYSHNLVSMLLSIPQNSILCTCHSWNYTQKWFSIRVGMSPEFRIKFLVSQNFLTSTRKFRVSRNFVSELRNWFRVLRFGPIPFRPWVFLRTLIHFPPRPPTAQPPLLNSTPPGRIFHHSKFWISSELTP